MIKQCVTLLILVMMISACASTGSKNVTVTDTETTEAETPAADTAEHEPMKNLVFADLSIFDKELSRVMKTTQDEIEVAPISKFTTNEIPDRLGKWFYMVDKHDGNIEMKSTDPTKRSILGAGAGLGFVATVYNAIRDKIMYKPAKYYDAVILYQPESGIVDKIIFKRKPLN